jgi:hypothetical protein
LTVEKSGPFFALVPECRRAGVRQEECGDIYRVGSRAETKANLRRTTKDRSNAETIDTKVVYSCTRTQFRDFRWVCPTLA